MSHQHTQKTLVFTVMQSTGLCKLSGKNAIRKDQKSHTIEEEYYFETHVYMPVYVIQHQFFHIKPKHLQYYNEDCNDVL